MTTYYNDHIIVKLSRELVQNHKGKLSPLDKFIAVQILAKPVESGQLIRLFDFVSKYKGLLSPEYNIQLPEELQKSKITVIEPEPDWQVKVWLNDKDETCISVKNLREGFQNVIDAIKGFDFKYLPDSKFWKRKVPPYVVESILSNPSVRDLKIYIKDKSLKDAIDKIKAESDELVHLSKSTDTIVDIPKHINDILFPFQRATLEYAQHRQNLLNADEMGLGKTLQALCIVEHRKHYPLIIICQAMLKLNLRNEVLKWFPEKKIQMVFGGKMKIDPNCDVYILNYDIFAKYTEELLKLKPKAIICDESHAIKNYKAKRSKAIMAFKKTPTKILLTGTPVINKPFDLINQLRFLDVLKYFGGSNAFAKRYCNPYWDGWRFTYNGATNIEELQVKLRQYCMVRREKKDVLTDLPDKIIQEVYLELPNIKEYKTLVQDIKKWWKKKIEHDKMLTEDEKQWKLDGANYYQVEEFVKLEYLRQAVAQFKLPQVYEWVDNTLEQEDKIVIFAHHINIVDAIHEHYKDISVVLKGGMQKEVQSKIDEFRDDPKKKIFVVSIMAGGTGLNLQFCHTMAFVELPWTWAIVDQAMSRIHRIGQDEPCNYYFLMAEDTVDKTMWDLVLSKKEIMESTTNYSKIKQLFESI